VKESPLSVHAIRVHAVPGSEVVAAQVWLRGGTRAEGTAGQASITGRLLAEGTRGRDWRQIGLAAEECGMALSSFGGFEALGVVAEALASDWQRALEWVLELALEPSFPQDRCHLLVRQNLAELASLGDQPEIKTARRFLDQLYRPHPRSRPVQGTPEGLSEVTPASCHEFHQQSLGRGLIVSVAGGIDEDRVRKAVEDRLSEIDTSPPPAVEPVPPEGLDEWHRNVPLQGTQQAHLFAGHLSVARSDPGFGALELLGVILGAGSGLNGRIPSRLREREGLAYSVETGTVTGAGLDAGRVYVHLGTDPVLLDRAERCLREEMSRLVEEGPTAKEVEEAQAYLVGREPFRRETPQQVADLAAAAELYGLPLDDPEWRIERWRSVGTGELAESARRHLRPDELRITIGRPRLL
jgi:zinc protease